MKIKLTRCFIAIVSLLTLVNCEFRPLTYEYNDGVPIRINIDWSEVYVYGTDAQGNPLKYEPQYIKAIFYSTDATVKIEKYIEPEGQYIFLPEDTYHVILYNWRINESAQTVQFTGENLYHSLQAMTSQYKNKIKGFTRMIDEPVILQPDSLYAWSTLNTPFVVEKRYNVNKQLDTFILNTRPKSLIEYHSFYVSVTGIQCIKEIGALVTGNAASVLLWNSQLSTLNSAIAFNMKSNTNGFFCYYTTFGHISSEEKRVEFLITLLDGTQIEEIRDITSYINQNKPIVVAPIEVTCDRSVDGGGFIPPIVTEWEDVYIDIPIR